MASPIPRSARLGRKEQFEDAVLVLTLASRTGIFNSDHDTGISVNDIGTEPQHARPGNPAFQDYTAMTRSVICRRAGPPVQTSRKAEYMANDNQRC
jgi:hypothetical protein